jgi:hypothetical protein
MIRRVAAPLCAGNVSAGTGYPPAAPDSPSTSLSSFRAVTLSQPRHGRAKSMRPGQAWYQTFPVRIFPERRNQARGSNRGRPFERPRLPYCRPESIPRLSFNVTPVPRARSLRDRIAPFLAARACLRLLAHLVPISLTGNSGPVRPFKRFGTTLSAHDPVRAWRVAELHP